MSTNKKLILSIIILTLITIANTPTAEPYNYQAYVAITSRLEQLPFSFNSSKPYSYSNRESLHIRLYRPEYPNLASISFSNSEFISYFDSATLPNTVSLTSFPKITNNSAADQKIIQIATNRGYKLRHVASNGSLRSYGGVFLQPPVISAWQDLRTEAMKNGFNLSIISGYRSIEQQRILFLQRLEAASKIQLNKSLQINQIATGTFDSVIESVLKTSSIPGTSKHHTGYTIDITDLNANIDFTNFSQTNAFSWLSESNYYNAKRFGFLPSYPEGVEKIGPNPEAWEYVWVGHPGDL